MASTDLTPSQRQRRIVVRTGIFVTVGLVLTGIVVSLIGRERNTFSQKLTFRAAFANVEGLQVQSPVRLGGLTVGRVTSVGFSDDLGDQRILVTLEVASKFRERVRQDSVARVTSRGVLGDKAIDISLGTPEFEVLENGGELKTGESGDLSALLKGAGELAKNATAIAQDLREGVAAFTAPSLRDDVTQLFKSARGIAQQIEQGQGALHALIYDAQTGEDVKHLVREASSVARRLDTSVARVDALLAQVQHGPGALHAAFYDPELGKALGELGKVAQEVSVLVHDARTQKKGAVHQLVYGDASNLLGDLGKAASDIKEITRKIREGEGSLGGIISDPTVYEDLKQVLGNVKRNRVLRALVRMSLSNEEEIERVGQRP